MVYLPAFPPSRAFAVPGACFGVRGFLAFLGSSAYLVSAASYLFCGIAPLPWRGVFSGLAPVVKLGLPVLASGSNSAVKPTRLRRAAYLGC
ncbi:DUF1010 domain-containing protein [Simplicispira psychrophila]|uniref:DUF1010 domain-containing protein n=1 Tax=Simplicispira psychrophila TaxID=80882 RepID=UPI0012EC8EE4|nr:DUF1010 domain-containing protein [Simplicispira psychrophila]